MRTMQEIFNRWRTYTNSCEAELAGKHLRLRVLNTPEQHQKGFMFEPEPHDGFGLLFVYEQEQPLSFWMRNVPYDLDLIGLDNDLRVKEVHRLIANDERTVSFSRPCRYALELKRGWCAKNGVIPGTKLKLNDDL